MAQHDKGKLSTAEMTAWPLWHLPAFLSPQLSATELISPRPLPRVEAVCFLYGPGWSPAAWRWRHSDSAGGCQVPKDHSQPTGGPRRAFLQVSDRMVVIGRTGEGPFSGKSSYWMGTIRQVETKGQKELDDGHELMALSVVGHVNDTVSQTQFV